jgi:hypothetical protein
MANPRPRPPQGIGLAAAANGGLAGCWPALPIVEEYGSDDTSLAAVSASGARLVATSSR